MKLEIEISQDQDLRVFVKELIKQQVVGLIRETFMEVIEKEVNGKIKGMQTSKFEEMIQTALRNQGALYVNNSIYASKWQETQLPGMLTAAIEKELKHQDFKKRVDDGVRTQINKLLTQ